MSVWLTRRLDFGFLLVSFAGAASGFWPVFADISRLGDTNVAFDGSPEATLRFSNGSTNCIASIGSMIRWA